MHILSVYSPFSDRVVVVVVVNPNPPPKNGGGFQQPFLRTPADGIPPSKRNPDPLDGWWPPLIQRAGAPHPREPSTNQWPVVVCGSVLQIGHSGDG